MFILEEWSEGSGKAGVGDSGGMRRGAVEQGAELERWRLCNTKVLQVVLTVIN